MRLRICCFSFVAAFCLAAGMASAAPGKKTIDNLKAAYLGESTAHAKYAAYAKKADKEGYRGAASLFRAASAAEGIHAAAHKAVLARLGVKNPKAGSFTKTPGATASNLKDAIKGETYERDVMYPKMLKDAMAEGESGAVIAMTYALAAEKQHADLYTSELQSLKRRAADTYAVCPVCGATYRKGAPSVCPVCGTEGPKFRRVV